MSTRPVVVLLSLALLAIGCNKGPAASEPQASKGSLHITELKTEDVKLGKPSEFNPKQKPIEAGDRIFVRYVGTFPNGEEFDSNMKEDKPVLIFTVGNHEMIKAWDMAFLGMYPGGTRKMEVPWSLGYGEKGSPVIPGKQDLKFTATVLDVVKKGDFDGYYVIDRVKGTGAEAKDGSTCTVEFELRTAGHDGIWDSSKIQGKNQTYQIGKKQALESIEDATKGMKVGGVRDVWLPPGLAPHSAITGYPEEPLCYVKLKLLSVK
jgi:FKBP-type peptidyl-prolyl cis-trans isomerase